MSTNEMVHKFTKTNQTVLLEWRLHEHAPTLIIRPSKFMSDMRYNHKHKYFILKDDGIWYIYTHNTSNRRIGI